MKLPRRLWNRIISEKIPKDINIKIKKPKKGDEVLILKLNQNDTLVCEWTDTHTYTQMHGYVKKVCTIDELD